MINRNKSELGYIGLCILEKLLMIIILLGMERYATSIRGQGYTTRRSRSLSGTEKCD